MSVTAWAALCFGARGHIRASTSDKGGKERLRYALPSDAQADPREGKRFDRGFSTHTRPAPVTLPSQIPLTSL